jgi:ketosteroid isomerase-like protein
VSQENVEIVRRVFAALERSMDVYWRNPRSLVAAMEAGDLPAEITESLAFLDPEAEWHPPREDPDSTQRKGREAIMAYLEQWLDAWEYWRIEPQSFLDAGDKVVAFVRSTAKGRASGFELPPYESAHLITVEDGRIVRVQGFYDRGEALTAAGLPK